jgi:hypothetical protein
MIRKWGYASMPVHEHGLTTERQGDSTLERERVAMPGRTHASTTECRQPLVLQWGQGASVKGCFKNLPGPPH